MIRRAIALGLLCLAIGAVPSAQAQPVIGTSCPNYVSIDTAASATLISGIAKFQRVYICSLVLLNVTAQNVSIVEGTGTLCATNILAVMGATTAGAAAGMPLGALGQLVLVSPQPFISSSVTQNNVCILLQSATRVSGALTYYAGP